MLLGSLGSGVCFVDNKDFKVDCGCGCRRFNWTFSVSNIWPQDCDFLPRCPRVPPGQTSPPPSVLADWAEPGGSSSSPGPGPGLQVSAQCHRSASPASLSSPPPLPWRPCWYQDWPNCDIWGGSWWSSWTPAPARTWRWPPAPPLVGDYPLSLPALSSHGPRSVTANSQTFKSYHGIQFGQVCQYKRTNHWRVEFARETLTVQWCDLTVYWPWYLLVSRWRASLSSPAGRVACYWSGQPY